MKYTNPSIVTRQSGIALPMILILLLVMTLLGVASLNTTVLEDQMSGNSRTREIAFNAAETTLRFAELKAEEEKAEFRGGNLTLDDGSTVQLFSGNAGLGGSDWPPAGDSTQPGDSCTGGYCIPAQYDLSGNVIGSERWEDPALDVWNTATRHLEYGDYDDSRMDEDGVFEAPKYIIEYMGDFPEEDLLGGGGPADYAGCVIGQPGFVPRTIDYPFCNGGAPSFFRITVRAVAGSPGRETVVVLQSTVRVP